MIKYVIVYLILLTISCAWLFSKYFQEDDLDDEEDDYY